MAGKGKGVNGNLLPVKTKKEATEKGRRGGIRSGEVKRERKFISAIYAEVLAKRMTVDTEGGTLNMTGEELVAHAVKTALATGGSPAVAMMKEIREATEGTKALMTIDNEIDIRLKFDPKGV